uniref:Uncharacterized protein n=1 Tax=Glossina pallidipes TaxID=7398 RepID=A0A1A9ZJF3_GLOPL
MKEQQQHVSLFDKVVVVVAHNIVVLVQFPMLLSSSQYHHINHSLEAKRATIRRTAAAVLFGSTKGAIVYYDDATLSIRLNFISVGLALEPNKSAEQARNQANKMIVIGKFITIFVAVIVVWFFKNSLARKEWLTITSAIYAALKLLTTMRFIQKAISCQTNCSKETNACLPFLPSMCLLQFNDDESILKEFQLS